MSASVVTSNTIKLTWNAVPIIDRNGANIRYSIYNSKGDLVTTTRYTSYTIYNLIPSTHYKYTVRVINDYGDGPEKEITVLTKPASMSYNYLYYWLTIY